MINNERKERLESIRKIIRQKGLDAVWISNQVNSRYLSGFTGSSGSLLIGLKDAYLLTDFRYLSQAAEEAPEFIITRVKEDIFKDIGELARKAGWQKVGFESKSVVYSTYTEMCEKLAVELIPLPETTEKGRIIKSDSEIDILRRGAELLDQAFNFIQKVLRSGMSENELALELETYLRRHGAEGPSFRFIVASGKRGAMPHGIASEKIIEDGDLVTIDFGAVFEGYSTDMTRTLALKKTDRRLREIYDIVYKAQREAANSVKPGLQVNEVDAVAREVIKDAGYGDYFGHGLGHGIGLETHEQPVLNRKKKTVLRPGMVVTIEPGIYIPGLGGVRIEDMVVVTKGGVEALTKSPRELITI